MDTNQDHVTLQKSILQNNYIHSTKDEFFFNFLNLLYQTSLSKKVFFKPNTGNYFSKSVLATPQEILLRLTMNLENSLKSRSTLLPLCVTHGIHSDVINAIFIPVIYLTAQKGEGLKLKKTIVVSTCTPFTGLQNLS